MWSVLGRSTHPHSFIYAVWTNHLAEEKLKVDVIWQSPECMTGTSCSISGRTESLMLRLKQHRPFSDCLKSFLFLESLPKSNLCTFTKYKDTLNLLLVVWLRLVFSSEVMPEGPCLAIYHITSAALILNCYIVQILRISILVIFSTKFIKCHLSA